MALCARKEYCRSEVAMKLENWDVSVSDHESLLDELTRLGFIDERRYVSAYVRDKVRFNQWGRIRIRYMLAGKKIPPEIIEEGFEGVEQSLFTEVLIDLLQKKDKTLRSESDPWIRKQKLIRFAAGRGFEMDEILKAIGDL